MFLYKTTPVACCCKAHVNGSCFVWNYGIGHSDQSRQQTDEHADEIQPGIHQLLYYLFHLRSGFFASHQAWYWHIPLFLFYWGILVFVMWLVGKMPLIGGGGIPQTRGVINGRITYRHPFIEMVSKFVGGILSFSAGLS